MGAPESTAFRAACQMFADAGARDEAIALFRRLADAGHVAACYNLGVLQLAGRHLGRDDASAEAYLRRAAAQGYARSFRPLGMMALRGRMHSTRGGGGDVRRYLAGQWFAKGWMAGDAEAHVLMTRHVSCLFACFILCPYR
ncbi:hypothetical protein JHS3_27330 [Jeongeupia sp. HS-3]|uniref:tetratricopeptide repeat protein n=1 Tax=Jeongeupia sp. HS-3 TaxID=1009682 RepID=UPI0018A3D081|nr:sel1 repeat family protein [Jeongeupia sp. HS-3]BCL76997.1 hypothetical protein JHS3_27330 [Jeongeupia sp. HS-3]